MFIDIAQIQLKAGKGGNGSVSWRKEKYEPAGGPAGGDGGNGGSIVIETDPGLRTLMDFRYKRSYKGENGEDGRNKKQYGRAGEDIILKVPVGTLIKDAETKGVIADLKEPYERFVIAKGGRGGKGNAKFATPTRQAPNFAQPGTKGEEKTVILELKLIADVGLIGFPNVGKSTLLSSISEAKPKIANYHFTTLKPNLGVVKIGEGKSYVIADIPGLIEGAHEGVGLGHDFLRHVERTKVLVHLVDISGFEGRDPVEDFHTINNELYKYNINLEKKPQILVANKMDLPGSEEKFAELKEKLKDEVIDILPLSAATRQGIEELKFKIWELVENTVDDYETYDEVYIAEVEEPVDTITVKIEEGQYIVEGEFIDRLIDRTYFDSMDSLRHFQKVLRDQGVIERLEELGIKEEEIVIIGGYEFEFFH